MTSSVVDVLLFRLDERHLAVELDLVSSVLDVADSQGMAQLDPRPQLQVADADAHNLEELGDDIRVGLLDMAGPPTVVLLGEVLGSEKLTCSNVMAIPPWIAGFLPPALHPACAVIDQKVVWLLDLDTLTLTSSA